MKGYVRKLPEDKRIDISLQQEGFDEVKTAADKLLKIIADNGGSLALNDRSTPDEVAQVTQMSKKVFKRTLGYLMSNGLVKEVDGVIRTVKK